MFFDDFVNFFIKIGDWLMEIDEKTSKNMKTEPKSTSNLICFNDFIIAGIPMFFHTIHIASFFNLFCSFLTKIIHF